MLRRSQLIEQLKDGQLASVCRVVRDLTHLQRSTKLNDQEEIHPGASREVAAG